MEQILFFETKTGKTQMMKLKAILNTYFKNLFTGNYIIHRKFQVNFGEIYHQA